MSLYDGPDWFRVLSPEVEIQWFGWRSTLAILHSSGWDITVQEDHMRREYSVYIRNKQTGLMGAGKFDIGIRQYLHQDMIRSGKFPTMLNAHIQLAQNIYLMEAAPNLECTYQINPYPVYERINSKVSLRDLHIFADAEPIEAEKEVIVFAPTVAELLQMALEKQAPEQERIRGEMMKQNSKLTLGIRVAA